VNTACRSATPNDTFPSKTHTPTQAGVYVYLTLQQYRSIAESLPTNQRRTAPPARDMATKNNGLLRKRPPACVCEQKTWGSDAEGSARTHSITVSWSQCGRGGVWGVRAHSCLVLYDLRARCGFWDWGVYTACPRYDIGHIGWGSKGLGPLYYIMFYITKPPPLGGG